jgi:hypothetical protein
MSDNRNFAAPPIVDRIRGSALIVGVAGVVVCVLGALLNPADFFRAYLMGYLFYAGVGVGSLAILMLQHLSGGSWGIVSRRILEAATGTLPLLAILFLPILAGMRHLYPWLSPEELAKPAVGHKQIYLSAPFFIGRAVFYFASWIALSMLLTRLSRLQDETGDPALTRKLQVVSAPGLLLYGLTATFAAIDWIMSLDPEWYSTIYGLLIMIGQALSALSVVIVTIVILSRYEPLSRVVAPRYLLDLGKLMLAFVMIWAYFSFSQFLLIWAGNLPEEIPWYLRRIKASYLWIGVLLILFHFAFPFLLLLSRKLKRHGSTIIKVATVIIVMRFFDLFWLTAPDFSKTTDQVHFGWMNLMTPVAVGGVWLWYFCGELKKRPLLPLHDPSIEEFLAEATAGGHH